TLGSHGCLQQGLTHTLSHNLSLPISALRWVFRELDVEAGDLSLSIFVSLRIFVSRSVFCGGFPTNLTLERAFLVSQDVELVALRARDWSQHGRLLQGAVGV
ncbi:hypothetical protein ACLOJK_027276, partial [Asimina triloba]